MQKAIGGNRRKRLRQDRSVLLRQLQRDVADDAYLESQKKQNTDECKKGQAADAHRLTPAEDSSVKTTGHEWPAISEPVPGSMQEEIDGVPIGDAALGYWRPVRFVNMDFVLQSVLVRPSDLGTGK